MTLKIILSLGFFLVGALVFLIDRGTFSWERRMWRRGVLCTDAHGDHFIVVSRGVIDPLRTLAAMEPFAGDGVGAFCDVVERLPDDGGWSYVPLGLFVRGMSAINRAVGVYPDDGAARRAYQKVAEGDGAGFDAWLDQMDAFIEEFE